MRFIIFLTSITWLAIACKQGLTREKTASVSMTAAPLLVKTKGIADTLPPVEPPATYSSLVYTGVQVLNAAPGTKSVLFNSKGTVLYAMNLEGMSVYAFDQASRKLALEYKFKATKGTGWDYVKETPIPSYQEKPVEACLSHDDKILWVSLHNAEGIVPIRVDSIEANRKEGGGAVKKVYLHDRSNGSKDSFNVPLITTGKTPKIISRTADNKHLLVSNWHSYNVSVLETDINTYPYAKVIKNVPVTSIPRGIAVDDAGNRSYVAIMGGSSISVINNSVWMKEKEIPVASNPRHILLDSTGRLFVSYNKLAKVACIDPETGKTLFTASTAAQPRTIILSKNHKFLFVTCYSSDKVEVLKINENSFSKVATLPCKGHPVGVDIFENENKLEAWVCSYTNGAINIFSFDKK